MQPNVGLSSIAFEVTKSDKAVVPTSHLTTDV